VIESATPRDAEHHHALTQQVHICLTLAWAVGRHGDDQQALDQAHHALPLPAISTEDAAA
jgi:hypothetical protein